MLARCSIIATCLLYVVLGVFAEVEVRIQLQHNLGDGFVDAGLITGTVADEVQHKSALRIDWNVPPAAVDQLKQLASKDGTYQLRIENNTGRRLAGDVLISLPARAFEASIQANHRLDMHATINGQLMGIQWRFERTLDWSAEARRDLQAWPAKSKAVVHLPVAGPDISDLAATLIDEKYSEKLSMAYNDIKSGGQAASGHDKEKAEKKAQKEKTFWEKNWMFVLAGAMLLFNVVAGKPASTAQQAPAAPARTR
eukprot:jgi/Ulvmu1/11263/UM073_0035.1